MSSDCRKSLRYHENRVATTRRSIQCLLFFPFHLRGKPSLEKSTSRSEFDRVIFDSVVSVHRVPRIHPYSIVKKTRVHKGKTWAEISPVIQNPVAFGEIVSQYGKNLPRMLEKSSVHLRLLAALQKEG